MDPHRIARQTEEVTLTQFTERQGSSRLHGDLPELHVPKLLQDRLGVVGFTHRHAPGSDHHVCRFGSTVECLSQGARIVSYHPQIE